MTWRGTGVRAASWLLAVGLLLTACAERRGGGTSAAPPLDAPSTQAGAPAAAPAPSAAFASVARSTPEPARAMEHLRVLAGDIGSRPATTEAERRAAEYIRGQLAAAGYQAGIETFDVDVDIGGSATLQPEDGAAVTADPMQGTPDRSATGPLVPAGLGRSSDLAGVPARGAVVLVDRGEITFGEKARNAEQAGAAGLVVVNNQPGRFRGDLGPASVSIPVVGVPEESGAALRALAAAGGHVTVATTTERVRGTSQNVVGKPSTGPCTAYLGAHYDSVPDGPGANDNASGTSLLLELARARRVEGVCVVAFGAEEVGLLGSRAYVRAHGVAEARFMLNFDMVAKATRPTLIGDPDLTGRAARLGADRGFTLRQTTSIGPGASSDHATFLSAGVPAAMFYSGDDEFIHTAQDDLANVHEADLARFLDLAAAVLDELTAP